VEDKVPGGRERTANGHFHRAFISRRNGTLGELSTLTINDIKALMLDIFVAMCKGKSGILTQVA
jgi:hypothetical protein